MHGKRLSLVFSVLALCTTALAGCGGSGSSTSTSTSANGKPTGSITVFAAASLTSAFEELGTAFMSANPGTTVGFNFAGSNTLAEQINQGAPVDVFASADPKNMDDVKSDMNDPMTFATNKVTVMLPAKNPAKHQDAQGSREQGRDHRRGGSVSADRRVHPRRPRARWASPPSTGPPTRQP